MKLPKLKPNKRSYRVYDLYPENEIYEIVISWLTDKRKTHRQLDKQVLLLDSNKSLGFQSMHILHYLGLKKEFHGIFENLNKNEIIKILNSDPQDFAKVIYLFDNSETFGEKTVKKYFVQEKFKKTDEWSKVIKLSEEIETFLEESKTKNKLKSINLPGANSQNIEAIFTPFLKKIGFSSQKNNLFEKYPVKKLRPDYFLALDEFENGILVEVERGQTISNNADLKNLWKTHICQSADYLFLFVPFFLYQNQIQVEDGKPTKTFLKVLNRLSPFFDEDNYTNVRGLVIFGY